MNIRSAGRELAFLAVSQLSQQTEMAAENLILGATRSLREVAKKQIKKVKKQLKDSGEFFFNKSLDQSIPNYTLNLQEIHDQVNSLELAAFALEESLDLPEFLNQPPASFNYAVLLIETYRSNKDKVNSKIKEILENKKQKTEAKSWSFERVLSIDRDLLRIAYAESLSGSDCPKVVIIDEAVNLADKYGTEQSPKFVNGVLAELIAA